MAREESRRRLLPAVGGDRRVALLPPGEWVCPHAGGAEPVGGGRGSLHILGGQVADTVHLVPPAQQGMGIIEECRGHRGR
jgi:hypothetical protein